MSWPRPPLRTYGHLTRVVGDPSFVFLPISGYCTFVIMTVLRSRCGHYIFALWFLSFFLLSFFSSPNLSCRRCLPYFYTWCGLSANLECRSEICCTRLTGNTGCKNDAKSCHLRTIAQLCQLSSPLRHVSTIGKNLLNSNISCRCPHNMANFGPLTAVIGWRVWSTPANFAS